MSSLIGLYSYVFYLKLLSIPYQISSSKGAAEIPVSFYSVYEYFYLEIRSNVIDLSFVSDSISSDLSN